MDECGPWFASVNSSAVVKLADEKLFLHCETEVSYRCPDPSALTEWYQEKKQQITKQVVVMSFLL